MHAFCSNIVIVSRWCCSLFHSVSSLYFHVLYSCLPPIHVLSNQIIIRKIHSFLWCTSHCYVCLCKPTIILVYFDNLSVRFSFFLLVFPNHSFTHSLIHSFIHSKNFFLHFLFRFIVYIHFVLYSAHIVAFLNQDRPSSVL